MNLARTKGVVYDMPTGSEPDDFCPSCGVPVPFSQRADRCPHCDEPYEQADGAGRPTGYLSTFGHGVCGFIAGGYVGAGMALTDPDATLGDPHLTLLPMLGALIGCTVTAFVGRALHTAMRRGFEALLMALMIGGFVVFVLALGGVSSPDTLGSTGAAVVVLCAPAAWRLMFARRGDKAPPHRARGTGEADGKGGA